MSGKTFISLASSATMFPTGHHIIPSPLTPELIQARLGYPELIESALNNEHGSTINAIKRRYGLELPESLPDPVTGRAPQVKLSPGDELFIVQAALPRLKAGEVHSDETVNNAAISFLRWRVQMVVDVPAPETSRGLPQSVFNAVIDHAHSIALWRGSTQLPALEEILRAYDDEKRSLGAAWKSYMAVYGRSEQTDEECNVYLKLAALGFHAIRARYVAYTKGIKTPVATLLWYDVARLSDENVDPQVLVDVMLARYSRLATGAAEDIEAERALIAPLLERVDTSCM